MMILATSFKIHVIFMLAFMLVLNLDYLILFDDIDVVTPSFYKGTIRYGLVMF